MSVTDSFQGTVTVTSTTTFTIHANIPIINIDIYTLYNTEHKRASTRVIPPILRSYQCVPIPNRNPSQFRSNGVYRGTRRENRRLGAADSPTHPNRRDSRRSRCIACSRPCRCRWRIGTDSPRSWTDGADADRLPDTMRIADLNRSGKAWTRIKTVSERGRENERERETEWMRLKAGRQRASVALGKHSEKRFVVTRV